MERQHQFSDRPNTAGRLARGNSRADGDGPADGGVFGLRFGAALRGVTRGDRRLRLLAIAVLPD
ncbi:hypothetical protein [Bradyrhizobium sp.]|uniref:hypothetical protein n=1 Tax=Bradyrhizobium sp. TaxID=376 RepID=UPI0025C591C0|nr:hypothetical protein [Bradyrhizobium sp.]